MNVFCNSIYTVSGDLFLLAIYFRQMFSVLLRTGYAFTFSEFIADFIHNVLSLYQSKTLKQMIDSLWVLSLPFSPILEVPVYGVFVVFFWID